MKSNNYKKQGGLKVANTFRLTLAAALVSSFTASLNAQEAQIEEVVVSGIRSSLANALEEKRSASNLIEVIQAEDIGKLPDQNLAEVLENVTGVQITRTAGIGTGVQIRGTNANRVEINGVSTVGSGSGRSGINFEDVNASIISSVEVTKASEAKTIEGSVGGTINLRTIRPLELEETLGSVRVQIEDSSLTSDGSKPRYSGAWGDKWTTDAGEFGVVISGSVTEQEAVSFRPRTDRDNIASPVGANPAEFLGIQFLVQEQENDDYDTTNLATTFEWAPNDNLKFHMDVIINEQERSRDQYRLQASGVSSLRQLSIPTAFETVDFGVGPGRFPAALAGTLEPDLDNDDDDPNLRFSSETNSRVTDSDVFSIGGEWQNDRLTASFELSSSNSDTVSPNLSTTLNFINPNCPLDGSSNDNCVPFIYDLSGGTLSFGVNYDSPFAPDPSDLLDPANVVLDQVSVDRNTNKNSEDALRLDFSYELDWNSVSSVDFGYRYNESSSKFEDIGDRIGGFSKMVDSPNGTLFSELLVPGPTNYNSGDNRDLYIRNFLLLDPDRSFSDPEGTIAILQAAVIAHDPDSPDILNLQSSENAFYDVGEETSALYGQVNFEHGIFRGNFGLRWVETEVDSVAFGPADANGVRLLTSTKGRYDFVLPRLNVVATVREDLLVRMGYGSDIRRPGFNNLNTGFTFDESENASVSLGNPGLEPEEVDSFDISAEWYFAPSAVVSVGYFTKDRTNIFGQDFEGALLTSSDEFFADGFVRETNPSCPGGGIFNPIVVPNVLGDPAQTGMCVDFTQPGNDPATTTQSGIELAFQYDLSSFEDSLGWASGFGVIANYTMQDFEGGSEVDTTSGRGKTVLGDVSIKRGLLDFSEDAYNFTVFYEKYGVSARMRYTWREGFRTNDFAGGANTSGSSTFSFPVHTLDRGQLNASINYDVNDQLNVGLEVVNLTEEGIDQHCVSETGPLCFVGIPDRRITAGVSYRF
ncbi:TonB-dependent receptor [Porticoccaceae bacterium]|nr:TonB-dependent receptor [Porticoccaceae bacterium]MDB2319509.1 TonB-dependent receptor [Porticoccaceae bacterium]